MGVVAEVAKELGGAVEGAFGIDDPRFLVEGVAEGGPGVGVLEIGESTPKIEFSALSSQDEALKEEVFKTFAKHLYGQEEVRAGMDPTSSIGGETAGRDDAVDVGVMEEVLRPGMEEGGEANVGAEMTRVGSDLEEGLGGGMEQEVVEKSGISKEEQAEGIGKGEDHVEMGYGEDAGERAINPLSALAPLAFRAVSIPAGVVGNTLRVPAGGAGIEVAPKASGSTDAETKKDLALPKGGSVFSEVAISVLPDDIRDL